MRHIKNEEEYQSAIRQTKAIVSSIDMFNDESRLEAHMLIRFIEEYERRHYPALPFTEYRNLFFMRIFSLSALKSIPLGLAIFISTYFVVTGGYAWLLSAIIATIFVLYFTSGFFYKEILGYIRDDILLLYQENAPAPDKKETKES